ncbi:16S rRNA (uracil(1498)-N(3))-methyltransferase [Xylophilus rhododendri]|uniref:Ribosomal RNA small subunit methyltransferase E n=1 Tax=Xylophilus rhododendri TaxID=2697032 RepID=A0A857J6Z4_9BURK|nr:16S rRNA (uracil(1498)-N(3))-methyltransferase [Xylophilus rhododendri]QHI98811.1 16S rRNA (uracil(1498)-N(3))-methyltransferase [Xylophilus rhododendri]
MPRIFCPQPLASGAAFDLPPGPARHVQVLRLQPGDTITLFDGRGGEYEATVRRMGRSDVGIEVGSFDPVEREAPRTIHLALGMPANDRMDWLVEKAAELGAASIQPLMSARTVLRLSGERAEKKAAHWQAVAVAACEQCGRNRVPVVHPLLTLSDWLGQHAPAPAVRRYLLSLSEPSQPLRAEAQDEACFLSGPEGGLTPQEEEAAIAAGFQPVRLGPQILRAETAPLAALMRLLG